MGGGGVPLVSAEGGKMRIGDGCWSKRGGEQGLDGGVRGRGVVPM